MGHDFDRCIINHNKLKCAECSYYWGCGQVFHTNLILPWNVMTIEYVYINFIYFVNIDMLAKEYHNNMVHKRNESACNTCMSKWILYIQCHDHVLFSSDVVRCTVPCLVSS